MVKISLPHVKKKNQCLGESCKLTARNLVLIFLLPFLALVEYLLSCVLVDLCILTLLNK